MKKIPSSAKAIVIGGGVVGCSCAYHLAKFGWKDVILLERDKLTSGTTWHAAGLVSQIGPSATITKIRKYSLDLYKELEKKIDHSAGLRLNGALSIAQEEGRWQELKRQATTAQLYNFDVQILNKEDIKEKIPSETVLIEIDRFGSVSNKTLDLVGVVSTTLPTNPLSLIADIFFLILSSYPAFILINLEKNVSFLFINEAVLIN